MRRDRGVLEASRANEPDVEIRVRPDVQKLRSDSVVHPAQIAALQACCSTISVRQFSKSAGCVGQAGWWSKQTTGSIPILEAATPPAGDPPNPADLSLPSRPKI